MMIKNKLFIDTFNKEIQTKLDQLRVNGRSVFVKMFSNAVIKQQNGDGQTNGANYQFLNGMMNTTSNSKFYQYEKDYRGKPIITSLSVSSYGTYGALRKCTVSIKCFSLEQLHNIQNYYMIPGITCVVQWGWTTSLLYNNAQLIDFSKHNKKIDIQDIYKLRDNCNYQSDMIYGVITNFSFQLSENGTFDCSVQLISMGNKFFLMYRDINDIQDFNGNTLKNYVNELIQENKDSTTIKNNFSNYNYKPMLIEVGQSSTSQQGEYKLFFPLGYIQQYLINTFIPTKTTDDKQMLNIGYNKVRYNSILRSIDPSSVIIPTTQLFQITNNYTLTPSMYRNYIVNKQQDQKQKINNNTWNGHIKDILVSADVLKTSLQKQTIIQALDYIVSVINMCSLQYYDIRIMPSDQSTYTFVDYNAVPIEQTKQIYTFNVYGQKIRSVTYSSQLPKDFKAIAVYCRNTQQKSNDMAKYIKRIWGQNIIDRTNTINTTIQREDIPSMYDDYQLNYILPTQFQSNILGNLGIAIDGKYLPLYKRMLFKTEPSQDSDKGRILPIDISIELDGISGIQYGQVFKIDYLPQQYKKYTRFIVTQVSDSISTNDWSTSISGVLSSTPLQTIKKEPQPIEQQLIFYKPTKYSGKIKMSQQGIEWLKKLQGMNNKPRCYGSFWTIGHGCTTLNGVVGKYVWGQVKKFKANSKYRVSRDTADKLLRLAVQGQYCKIIDRLYGKFYTQQKTWLTQHAIDALIIQAYLFGSSCLWKGRDVTIKQNTQQKFLNGLYYGVLKLWTNEVQLTKRVIITKCLFIGQINLATRWYNLPSKYIPILKRNYRYFLSNIYKIDQLYKWGG